MPGRGRPKHLCRRWPLGDLTWQGARCEAGDPVSRLILRNTKVGALQDSAYAWPPDLDLEGFQYDRLSGQLQDDAR